MAEARGPLRPVESKRRSRRPLGQRLFVLPSLVTAVSIFCGFLAILESFRGNYVNAVACIALSIILDGLDGRLARRLNATSEFGREFDSMSDIVSFGVAPAVLAYSWGFSTLADEFGLIIAFSFVASGAVRLARFNIDTTPRKHFLGLPIPAGAAAIAAMVYIHPEQVTDPVLAYSFLTYVVTLAMLMVSATTYISVKYLRLTSGNVLLKFFCIMLLVAFIWYSSRVMFLLLTLGYVISGPALSILNRVTGKRIRPLRRLFADGEEARASAKHEEAR